MNLRSAWLQSEFAKSLDTRQDPISKTTNQISKQEKESCVLCCGKETHCGSFSTSSQGQTFMFVFSLFLAVHCPL